MIDSWLTDWLIDWLIHSGADRGQQALGRPGGDGEGAGGQAGPGRGTERLQQVQLF